MILCPRRRLPTNPGVSLTQPDGTRISVVRSGRSATGSAADLPSGFWLTDLSYSDARLIDAKPLNRVIHPDGWIGAPWRRIIEDCGFETPVSRDEVQGLAELSERIIRLSVCAADESENCRSFGKTIGDRRTFGRPSLAFGLSDYLRTALAQSRPLPAELAAASKTMLVFGTGSRAAEFRRGRILTAVKPRFTHLRRLAEQPVPGSRNWREIELSEKGSPMRDSLQESLLALGRPVILYGVFQPFQLRGPAWIRGWLKGPDPSWGRNWFTLQEIVCLRRFGVFHAEASYAGPRPSRPLERTVLGKVSRRLAAACRSRRTVRCSWSAGWAAENLIRAACGEFRKERASAASMESVWIAANDRIACLPAIEAAEAAGAECLALAAGAVTIGIPGGAEEAARVADALWRVGFHLSPGTARRLKYEGADLLTDAAEFGGQSEDLLLATASQHGLCGLVRRMDTLADGRKSRCNADLDRLEAALARFPS